MSIWLGLIMVCLTLGPSNKYMESFTQSAKEPPLTIKSNNETGIDSALNGKIAWPPLESLIQNETVTGDVQFLMDLTMIGFAKCSSTTMRNWLCNYNDESRCLRGETFHLFWEKPGTMVASLYNDLPKGNYKRGYKSQNDISRIQTLTSFHNHWPETILFIGLRHPVEWFESFWNFRMTKRTRSISFTRRTDWVLSPRNVPLYRSSLVSYSTFILGQDQHDCAGRD